mmetsp:Transcript_11206/g.20433  ORF Transcript_11206/g.20433 Transcript_11206/m.20433 type:complete len:504 (+) Transcript_11206:638-2149(+)|eukprot:CAMPEP_0198286780 /NCGR_PEP_ID=MMETSP1449-20131203/5757_1 /TAXON_ID=420275 /ORGANISM="Attheya septentrionalis, Strain CCMP2084" /LENGTH=503 /DNA_ID=CAMNT_0043984577 /DNA_START=579 /DNA_END=2090 /DNA_ORIENTATION=-
MSERMVELERAKMGLPPLVQPKTTNITNNGTGIAGAQSGTPSAPAPAPAIPPHPPSATPTATTEATAPPNRTTTQNQTLAASSSAVQPIKTTGTIQNGVGSGLLVPPTASASTAEPSPNVAPLPQEQATSAATMDSEDARLQKFLHLLASRSQAADASSFPIMGSSSMEPTVGAPTVPIALSRRLLHRSGVGYLDECVPAIASAAADRFLATVLHQAMACRDRRLAGAELLKREGREYRRHRKRIKAEENDRLRRKRQKEDKRRHANINAISAATKNKSGDAAPGDSSKKSKSKKVKKNDASEGVNATSKTNDEHDLSDDSIDEEEEYYNSHRHGDDSDDELSTNSGLDEDENSDEDSDDENRDLLLLRDLVRPLEAWGMSLAGKAGLCAAPVFQSVETMKENDGDGDTDDDGDDVGEETSGAEFGGRDSIDSIGDDSDVRTKTARKPSPKSASSTKKGTSKTKKSKPTSSENNTSKSPVGGRSSGASSPVPPSTSSTVASKK